MNEALEKCKQFTGYKNADRCYGLIWDYCKSQPKRVHQQTLKTVYFRNLTGDDEVQSPVFLDVVYGQWREGERNSCIWKAGDFHYLCAFRSLSSFQQHLEKQCNASFRAQPRSVTDLQLLMILATEWLPASENSLCPDTSGGCKGESQNNKNPAWEIYGKDLRQDESRIL